MNHNFYSGIILYANQILFMKKTLLAILFFITHLISYGQVKIGLNFSPGIAFNRLNYERSPNDKNWNFSSNGVGLRFIAGPAVSFYFSENYAFTTGLWYSLKRTAYTYNDTNTTAEVDKVYNLQYLLIPATFKLFTNEIATDTKIYFQLGGTADIKISEKQKGNSFKNDAQFRFFDVSLLVGSGIELQMGESTYFLAGLRYTRGLIDVIKSSNEGKHFDIKNELISLDLGIRF